MWDRYDNFTDSIMGGVTTFCRGDAECWEALAEATLEGADDFEAMDMPARIEQTAALIRDEVYADPRIEWPAEYFDHKVECLIDWSEHRPEAGREWVEAYR